MREISFIRETHLGDCIMHNDFLNKMVKLDDNIIVHYYIIEKYKEQVEQFIENPQRVISHNRTYAPKNAERAWMAQYGHITTIPFDFGLLKLNFYKKLCEVLNLKCPYSNIIDLLPDSDLLIENPNDDKWAIIINK